VLVSERMKGGAGWVGGRRRVFESNASCMKEKKRAGRDRGLWE